MKRLLIIILTAITMQNVMAQNIDYDIYSPTLIEDKGVLILLNETDNNLSSNRDTWWVSQKGFTLDILSGDNKLQGTLKFDKVNPYGIHSITEATIVRSGIKLGSNPKDCFLSPIPAGPLRVVEQDDLYYKISAKIPSLTKSQSPAYFLVRKSQIDSLGFKYVSCVELLQLLKNGRINVHSYDPIAFPIFPELSVNPRNFGSYYINFILRAEDSYSSPFLCIVEPHQSQFTYEIISKDNYWYKLKIYSSYTEYFGTETSDGVRQYMGEVYTGYWQAPFDEAGFPYLLVDIIKAYDGWYNVLRELGKTK